MCILGTSQIQDLDPSRVVCVLCSFSTLSLTHAPALYSYGLLASPGTDMPYPGSKYLHHLELVFLCSSNRGVDQGAD